ncbi:MAG: tRNA pseudouridine(38-40) synthase TruA [Galactobacter sp.]
MSSVRLALTLAYDGTDFHGWARQPGHPSVQQCLEEALFTITREQFSVVVAGRTDAGVHARGQVIHLDLSESAQEKLRVKDGASSLEKTLGRRLNAVLRRSAAGAIRIREVRRVPSGFDARFSALWRSYTYTVNDRRENWDPLRRRDVLFLETPLDVPAMKAEALSLLGLHDFLSYCKPRAEATTIRELQAADVRRDGDLVTIHLRADAFCHHMVRTIVGALIGVGSGKQAPGWARQRLDARVRDASTRMVAGHALVLEEVGYPDDQEVALRAVSTRARRTDDATD